MHILYSILIIKKIKRKIRLKHSLLKTLLIIKKQSNIITLRKNLLIQLLTAITLKDYLLEYKLILNLKIKIKIKMILVINLIKMLIQKQIIIIIYD